MNLVLPALLATSPLPSAVPVAPGHGAIYLQPGISLTAFDAQAGVQVGLPARLVVSAGGSFAGPVGGFDAALRWNVVESEHFSFGPWLGYTLTTSGADGASAQGPSVGVAVEGGGDVLRGDLSLTALTWNIASLENPEAPPLVVPLSLSTVGVTARLGGVHSVRLGLDPGFTPRLGYRADVRHWSVGGGVTLVNLESPGAYVVGGFHW